MYCSTVSTRTCAFASSVSSRRTVRVVKDNVCTLYLVRTALFAIFAFLFLFLLWRRLKGWRQYLNNVGTIYEHVEFFLLLRSLASYLVLSTCAPGVLYQGRSTRRRIHPLFVQSAPRTVSTVLTEQKDI